MLLCWNRCRSFVLICASSYALAETPRGDTVLGRPCFLVLFDWRILKARLSWIGECRTQTKWMFVCRVTEGRVNCWSVTGIVQWMLAFSCPFSCWSEYWNGTSLYGIEYKTKECLILGIFILFWKCEELLGHFLKLFRKYLRNERPWGTKLFIIQQCRAALLRSCYCF